MILGLLAASHAAAGGFPNFAGLVSEMSGLSPWGLWAADESSGNLADSSGNGRTMTANNIVTYQSDSGYGATYRAFNGSSHSYCATTATINTSAFTVVSLVQVVGTPSIVVPVVGVAQSFNSGTTDKNLWVKTDGTLALYTYAGSAVETNSGATKLSNDTWYLVAGRVGASGTSVWINGSSVGTNAATTSATYNGLVFIHTSGNAYVNLVNGDDAIVACSAVWASALSDTNMADLATAAGL